MQILIIDVAPPETHTAKNGKEYQSVEVTYKGDNGQTSSKKLMSFANPQVFKGAQTWVKGNSINIDSQKDDNGYWQWKGILAEGQAPAVQVSTAQPRVGQSAPTRVTGNNYPTADERNMTQTYIIRQSSLGHAVATLAIEGSKATANDVIALASMYEGFVKFGTIEDEKANTDLDMDDIPS
jgi:hypothetical protein